MTTQDATAGLAHSVPKVVAEGLGWPEGPTLLDDGSIAFVETYRSRLSAWSPTDGGVSSLCDAGGGPNAALAGHGSVFFTQNSGIVGPWRAPRQQVPGVWKIDEDGAAAPVVTSFEGRPFGAPNDLAFGPDGRLYFTDPGEDFRAHDPRHPGRIYAVDGASDPTLVVDTGTAFPNGIAFSPDGVLYWTETYEHRVMRLIDGASEVFAVLDEGTGPDGLKFTEDGILFVTTGPGGKSVEIFAADGSHLDTIRFRDDSTPSNCLFVGSTLYVTDGGCDGGSTEAQLTGRLWAIEFDDLRGLDPH